MANPTPEENMRTPRARAQRGNTCYNCRRRRIKCDGIQPSCTNCIKGGSQFEDCEYPVQGHASQASILEDMIASVKNRIRVLEDPNQADQIALHQPYDSNETLVDLGNLSAGALNRSEASTSAGLSSSTIEWDALFRIVVSNPYLIGFFLSPNRLQPQTVLDNLLGTAREHLTPALREVMSLWNIRLSRPRLDAESAHLSTTLDRLSEELALGPRRNIIELIQVEVMLGYYFLHDGKLLQALHHVDSALSITLAAGLCRSKTPVSTSGSREALEEVNGFWSVVALSNLCAIVSGVASAVHPIPITDIGTQVTDSMQVLAQCGGTLETALQETNVFNYTPVSPYTMATVLLERVSNVPKHSTPYPLPWSEVIRLEKLLNAVITAVLAIDLPLNSHSPPSVNRQGNITQLIVHATMIQLHIPYVQDLEQSRRHCRTAALAIADSVVVVEGDLWKAGISEPTLGAIWPVACEALACDIISGQLNEVDHRKSISALATIYGTWNRFSSESQYFALCLSKCERELGLRIQDILSGTKP